MKSAHSSRNAFDPRAGASHARRRDMSRPPSRRRNVPRLESLEDRLAPATFLVTNLTDDVAAGGGLSLREAIRASTTRTSVDRSPVGTGNDVIRFDPILDGGTISLYAA